MKLMGAIQSQKLDVVLMNREAYDLLSRKAYLAELPALLKEDPALAEQLEPILAENSVVLTDNTIEVLLGEADTEEQVTQSAVNALAVSSLPLFQNAGFDGEIYLGLVANSPRSDTVLHFFRYLCDCGAYS